MKNNNDQKKKSRKETLVDTLGLVASSLTGVVPDYFSGLRGTGILAARAYGVAAIFPTGGPYGKWRNFLYKKTKTTDKSSKLRDYLVELTAFNSFQIPLYATTLAIGSLASNMMNNEFRIDPEKIIRGVEFLLLTSPISAPGLGFYMEEVRKLFKLESAPEKARKSLENKVNISKPL